MMSGEDRVEDLRGRVREAIEGRRQVSEGRMQKYTGEGSRDRGIEGRSSDSGILAISVSLAVV